jgi:FkbM family methyltransferase
MQVIFTFRNFPLMLGVYFRLIRQGRGLQAVLWDGTRYTLHPDLPELSRHLIQEAWSDNCYALPPRPQSGRRVVVDIGANLGSFALAAAQRYPDGLVYCFEPGSDNFALLQQNIEANHLEDRVKAWPKAVSDRDGKATFYRSDLAPTRHSLLSNELFQTAGGLCEEVETVSLASFFEAEGIECCDLLKLDCEGAEYAILLGVPDAVLARVQAVVMEYHDGVTEHHHGELIDFLQRRGFQVQVEPSPDNAEFGIIRARRPHSHS